MPSIEQKTAGTAEQEQAWRQAEADGQQGRSVPVTGQALANEDQELARNQMLARPSAAQEINPKQIFRQPRNPNAPADVETVNSPPPDRSATDMPLHQGDMTTLYEPPHERKARTPTTQAAPEPSPVAATPPPTPIPDDDEGLRLEREIIGGGTTTVDDLPDQMVTVGGREIPLSTIRDGLQAAKTRDHWQAEYTKKQQALSVAVKEVMREAAAGYLNDPVGSLRRLGLSDDDIAARMSAAGLPVGRAAQAPPTAVALPEDADPTTKALFHQNEDLRRTLSQQQRAIEDMRQTAEMERQQRSEQANEAARLATISGVKSELLASASKMPSMRGADGKISQLGDVLVDATMLRLEREMSVSGVPDHAAVRQRAFALFGEQARAKGITPKAEQARKAIEGRKPPIPSRPGTTIAGVHPGAAAQLAAPKLGTFDFSDDDARKRAGRAWMAAHELDTMG